MEPQPASAPQPAGPDPGQAGCRPVLYGGLAAVGLPGGQVWLPDGFMIIFEPGHDQLLRVIPTRYVLAGGLTWRYGPPRTCLGLLLISQPAGMALPGLPSVAGGVPFVIARPPLSSLVTICH